MKRSKYERDSDVERWHGWKLLAFWIPTIIVVVAAYTAAILWLFG